jgi:pilus assembly protein Flp/PilA
VHTFVLVLRDESAATAVEYGLILALVFLTMAVGLSGLGNATQLMWNSTSSQVETAVNQATG